MQKILKSAVFMGAALMLPGTMAHAQDGEVGYAQGSLGYDALMAGENESAIAALEAQREKLANDPAWMINLGQAYARTGRTGDAARMFMAAMNSNRSFDLVLADGAVVNSREAAEAALSNLNNRLASR